MLRGCCRPLLRGEEHAGEGRGEVRGRGRDGGGKEGQGRGRAQGSGGGSGESAYAQRRREGLLRRIQKKEGEERLLREKGQVAKDRPFM